MSKQLKINEAVAATMTETWQIEISDKPFIEGKSANLPSFGYPCAVCADKDTKIRFAESTEEEDSNLQWMELQCKSCKNYTRYTRK